MMQGTQSAWSWHTAAPGKTTVLIIQTQAAYLSADLSRTRETEGPGQRDEKESPQRTWARFFPSRADSDKWKPELISYLRERILNKENSEQSAELPTSGLTLLSANASFSMCLHTSPKG